MRENCTLEIEDTKENREKNPELFIINMKDEGIMGIWCGCGHTGFLWWKKRKYSYRKIIKEYKDGENGNMLGESHSVCNHCNKLAWPSGYWFKEQPSIEERLKKLEEAILTKI